MATREQGPGDGPDSAGGSGEIPSGDREAFRKRASEIGSRIDRAKERYTPPPAELEARGRAYGQATKIAAELVAGVAVGAFIGWALDRHFGTAPWLMIVFLMLGFAAGLLNTVRSAQRMQKEAEAAQLSAKPAADDEDDA